MQDTQPGYLPIEDRHFKTSSEVYTAHLISPPGPVFRDGREQETICHNLEFHGKGGNVKKMLFWLSPAFAAMDPTMGKAHKAAFDGLRVWLETGSPLSTSGDYWLTPELKLEPFIPFPPE